MKQAILLLMFSLVLAPFAFGQSPRVYLNKAQLQETFVGKTFTSKLTNGVLIKFDVKQDGLIYFTNLSQRGNAATGSGKYEIKDDGSLCSTWNNLYVQGGCSFYFRDGAQLKRTNEMGDIAPVTGEVVSFE